MKGRWVRGEEKGGGRIGRFKWLVEIGDGNEVAGVHLEWIIETSEGRGEGWLEDSIYVWLKTCCLHRPK